MYTITLTNIVSEYSKIPTTVVVELELGWDNSAQALREIVEHDYEDNIISFDRLGWEYKFKLEDERW